VPHTDVGDPPDAGTLLREPGCVRATDLELHHLAELGHEALIQHVGFRDAEATHVLERDVDPVLL
jgi:hypothetical protein